MRFSITLRFMLITVPMFVFGGVVSGVTWYSLNTNGTALIEAQRVNELAILSRLHFVEMSDAMKSFMINPQNSEDVRRKEAADAKSTQVFEELKTVARDPEIQTLLDKMSSLDKAQLNPAEDSVLRTLKEGKILEAQEAYSKVYMPLREQMNELSNVLSEKAHNMSVKQTQSIHDDMRSAAIKIISVVLLGVLGVGVVIFVMVSRLASGLRVLTQSLSQAGLKVGAASSQLASASQDVSSSSTQAAASLQQTVASIEELSGMVKLNADHAREASSLSQVSSQSAEEGETEIKNLIGSMNDISQSSRKIEEIITVIDDIAFQTNLLALNAAVEAARAGEQGKGFAVVAEAVRNLAQRSASAAKDISSLIKDSVVKIEHGAQTADRSGTVLKNIVTSVKKVAELNHEIAMASSEQASGIGQISKAMTSLDGATQKNAAASEEMAASSEEMSTQATLLQKLVGGVTALIEGHAETGAPERSAPRSQPAASPRSLHARTPVRSSGPQQFQPREKPRLALIKTPSGERVDPEKAIPFSDSPASKVGTTDGF